MEKNVSGLYSTSVQTLLVHVCMYGVTESVVVGKYMYLRAPCTCTQCNTVKESCYLKTWFQVTVESGMYILWNRLLGCGCVVGGVMV